jgi:hypothetical protein
MFNSPLGWCTVVRRWVALDEKISDCMRLQRCGVSACPHAERFTAGTGQPAAGGVRPGASGTAVARD